MKTEQGLSIGVILLAGIFMLASVPAFAAEPAVDSSVGQVALNAETVQPAASEAPKASVKKAHKKNARKHHKQKKAASAAAAVKPSK